MAEADLADVGGHVEPDEGKPGHGGLQLRIHPAPVVDYLNRDSPGHDDRDTSPPRVDVQIDHAVVELGLREVDAHTAQVRAEVQKIMDQAKAEGGFVLMPTAAPINLPLSPKTEANYKAFIDAGLEFGGY